MKIFKYLILSIALLLSGIAAYYSVFGLAKLFAGSYVAIIIMASIIEVGKLISVTILKRYWNKLTKLIRIYLLIATFFVMILTSLGIYGFLTYSYQETINKKTIIDSQVSNLEFKKNKFKNDLQRQNEILENKNIRINKLTDIRINQENRIDSLYSKNYYSVAKRTEQSIENANIEIENLTSEINKISNNMNGINDSILYYEYKIIESNSNELLSELGPLIYISKLLNIEMDKVINFLILLIIIVFDPL